MIGVAHWHREKAFIVKVLDEFTPNNLKEVNFSLAIDGGQHQTSVTHLVANTTPE